MSCFARLCHNRSTTAKSFQDMHVKDPSETSFILPVTSKPKRSIFSRLKSDSGGLRTCERKGDKRVSPHLQSGRIVWKRAIINHVKLRQELGQFLAMLDLLGCTTNQSGVFCDLSLWYRSRFSETDTRTWAWHTNSCLASPFIAALSCLASTLAQVLWCVFLAPATRPCPLVCSLALSRSRPVHIIQLR